MVKMRGSVALIILGCLLCILSFFPVLINAVAARLPRTSAGQLAAAAAAANLTAPQLRNANQNKTLGAGLSGTNRGHNSRNRYVHYLKR